MCVIKGHYAIIAEYKIENNNCDYFSDTEWSPEIANHDSPTCSPEDFKEDVSKKVKFLQKPI